MDCGVFWRTDLSNAFFVEYKGFSAGLHVRNYIFSVRQSAMQPRDYTLTIPNEAFESHRARYQDAPEICSLRLHREMGEELRHLPETHYAITEAELEDYRNTHWPKLARDVFKRKAEREAF